MERLQKFIASSGYTSRRKAEELIKNGKVKVNGKTITELGTKVEYNDQVEVEGNLLEHKDNKVYYLLNKPRGVISSVSDDLNRTTVVSLIDTDERIYPIGRLDYDTTGLLLLTNDGELANILMHPKNEVEKTYIAKIEGTLTPSEFYGLKKGIMIEGRKVTPTHLKVRKTDSENKSQIIEISIIEGRNHIVKKIFDSLNHQVIKLKRESYAFLTLGNLKSGEYRPLTLKEVKKLYSLK
jgi:23S rRNA pseudouridine2605 synthase